MPNNDILYKLRNLKYSRPFRNYYKPNKPFIRIRGEPFKAVPYVDGFSSILNAFWKYFPISQIKNR